MIGIAFVFIFVCIIGYAFHGLPVVEPEEEVSYCRMAPPRAPRSVTRTMGPHR